MKDIEALEFTLTKTRNYILKPFGRFKIKLCPNKSMLAKPHVLGFDQISFDARTGMPYSDEQHQVIAKYMIKHKTDVLINSYGDYFTFMGSGLVEIRHNKLRSYKNYLDQREAEDCPETWNNYIQRL